MVDRKKMTVDFIGGWLGDISQKMTVEDQVVSSNKGRHFWTTPSMKQLFSVLQKKAEKQGMYYYYRLRR